MNLRQFWKNYKKTSRAWRLRGEAHDELSAIILEQAKVVYFPVPKAANSSIRVALSRCLGVSRAAIQDHQDIHSDLIPHCKASDILSRLDEDWLLFTVTRAPYDRARSAWRDKVFDANPIFKPSWSMGLESGDRFIVFLCAVLLWPTRRLNDHFMQQTVLLRDVLATGRLQVIHMEDLAEKWPEMCNLIEARGGVRPDNLPHLNRSSNSSSHRYSLLERVLLYLIYDRDRGPLGY